MLSAALILNIPSVGVSSPLLQYPSSYIMEEASHSPSKPMLSLIPSDCSVDSPTDLVDLDRPSRVFSEEGATKIQHQFTAFTSVGSEPTSPFESSSSCAGCGYDIRDRYLLKVMSECYHEHCLRCVACHQNLASADTCYTKDGHVYCREDHSVLFGRRCGRCRGGLQSSDLVYRCVHATYHSQCFTCYYCNTQFAKGDEYLIVEGEIVCRNDYHLMMQAHLHSVPGPGFELDPSDPSRKTPKRPRTILNAQQRKQFKAAFEKSAKPCRKVREQLAKETGLSVRVVQVWFQNQRAKMKKIQRKEDTKRSSAGGSEGKTEDTKSSDEEADSDVDEDTESDSKVVLTELDMSNPIEKLYHMQSTYFQFT